MTRTPSSNSFGDPKQNQDCKKSYKSPINKDDLWCNYCKKPRHSKEMCWKLKGKPSFGKNNNQQQFIPRNSQANAAVSDFSLEHPTNNEPEIGTLNKEEIEKLRSFLTSISCSFAQSGNNSISHALSVSKDCKTHEI